MELVALVLVVVALLGRTPAAKPKDEPAPAPGGTVDGWQIAGAGIGAVTSIVSTLSAAGVFAGAGGTAATVSAAASGGVVGASSGAAGGGATTAGGTAAIGGTATGGTALGTLANFGAGMGSFILTIATVAITLNLISRASYSFRVARSRFLAGLAGQLEAARSWIYTAEKDALAALAVAAGGTVVYGDRDGEVGDDKILEIRGVAPELLALIERLARGLGIEQARGLAEGMASYFRNEFQLSDAQIEIQGVAVPAQHWPGAVGAYYATHPPRWQRGAPMPAQPALLAELAAKGFGKQVEAAYFVGQVAAVRYELDGGRITVWDGKWGLPTADLTAAVLALNPAAGATPEGANYAAAVNRTFALRLRQYGWWLYDDAAGLGFHGADPTFAVVERAKGGVWFPAPAPAALRE